MQTEKTAGAKQRNGILKMTGWPRLEEWRRSTKKSGRDVMQCSFGGYAATGSELPPPPWICTHPMKLCGTYGTHTNLFGTRLEGTRQPVNTNCGGAFLRIYRFCKR